MDQPSHFISNGPLGDGCEEVANGFFYVAVQAHFGVDLDELLYRFKHVKGDCRRRCAAAIFVAG